MADAATLDPNQWIVGVEIDTGGRVISADMMPTLYSGLSAMDVRLFHQLDKSGLPIAPERFALLHTLVRTIDSWKLAPRTVRGYARALKRFVRWADELGGALTRTTIVPLLASYHGDTAHYLTTIRRALAEATDLTDDERILLFPPVTRLESSDDDWVIEFEVGSGRRSADFLRLVAPGDAVLPSYKFADVREARRRKALQDPTNRTELVRALRAEFKACATARSYAPSSLVTIFRNLRGWVLWADGQRLDLNQASAIETLVSYSQHLVRQWRAGILADKTVHILLKLPAYILARALDQEPFEITYQLALPPLRNSGWTSVRPDTYSLQRFCGNLNAIVSALPSGMLCAPVHDPVQVRLCSGGGSLPHRLPEPYGGFGDQVFDPRLANLPLTRLRVWAEMYRFVGVTGCNLSVVQDLTVADWRADGPRMAAIKARANKLMSVRVSRRYERHVAAHVEFLEAAWPLPIEDATPLFPGMRFSPSNQSTHDLVARLRASVTKPRTTVFSPITEPGVANWLKANGLTIASRQLRRAKAKWLFRRYSGDSLRVSQALGNTPESAYDHYGGKGNLEQAIPEWSRHWASPQSLSALAPGKCESPGRYEPVNDQDASPGSCNEGGCLGCWHYRGEESLDYIHRMLSYRHCLHFRVASNSAVERLIGIIDEIVDAYLEKNGDQREAVRHLESQIRDKPHPRFAAMIRLLECEHAS